MGAGPFFKFLGAPMILLYNAKSVFLMAKASLCWINNVSGVYLVQVSLLFIGQQGLGHFFKYRPLLPIGRSTALTPEENDKKSANHF
jgi:hypothetical protein